MKITTERINEITRAMNALEELKIGFIDFDFNMGLGIMRSECLEISKIYENSFQAFIAANREKNLPTTQKQLDNLLSKEYEIAVPNVTVELIKGASGTLPTSVMSMLTKYIKK